MAVIDDPSPNHNARRLPVSILVLHYTGMRTGAEAVERLKDPDAGVSAHYVVEEDGAVRRLVAEEARAWHAGKGAWRGIDDVNSASIGVEIVNGGHEFGLPPYPEAQIAAVIALCRDILRRWAIAPRDVIGHSDMAPDRKTDPGERFPWARLAEAGIGLWPGRGDGARRLLFDSASHAEAEDALAAVGYDARFPLEHRLAAFQRRFRTGMIDGRLDAETLDLIRRVRALFAG